MQHQLDRAMSLLSSFNKISPPPASSLFGMAERLCSSTLGETVNVVSWFTDTGSKGYPLLGLARGVKEARKHLPREYLAKFFRSTCKQATRGHKDFTQVQAARRRTALLLHVWIDWFIMV